MVEPTIIAIAPPDSPPTPMVTEVPPVYAHEGHEHDSYAAITHEHDGYARHETVAFLEARIASLEARAMEAPVVVAEQPENAVTGVEAGLGDEEPHSDVEVIEPEIKRRRLETSRPKKRRAF